MKSINVSVGNTGVRVGESFALYGSGDNTYLYVASNRTSGGYDGRLYQCLKLRLAWLIY